MTEQIFFFFCFSRELVQNSLQSVTDFAFSNKDRGTWWKISTPPQGFSQTLLSQMDSQLQQPWFWEFTLVYVIASHIHQRLLIVSLLAIKCDSVESWETWGAVIIHQLAAQITLSNTSHCFDTLHVTVCRQRLCSCTQSLSVELCMCALT